VDIDDKCQILVFVYLKFSLYFDTYHSLCYLLIVFGLILIFDYFCYDFTFSCFYLFSQQTRIILTQAKLDVLSETSQRVHGSLKDSPLSEALSCFSECYLLNKLKWRTLA